jgi:hypothetical protein
VGTTVAEFAVSLHEELVPFLMGFGAQFNQNVFVPIAKTEPGRISGAPEGSFADLEEKVVDLAPQFVRVFFEPGQSPPPGPSGLVGSSTLDSLIRTVNLARKAGATILVTLAGGDLPPAANEGEKAASPAPDPSATSEPAKWQAGLSWFAEVLEQLVTPQPTMSLWVTLENEPNTPGDERNVTPENVGEAYRYLDTILIDKGLRSKEPGGEQRVRYMGGDLVENDQAAWFEYMAEDMADLFDAYSVHIYWNYWDTARFIERLAGVQAILESLPEGGRKPVLVTEHGLRGYFGWPTRSDEAKLAASYDELLQPAPSSGFFVPATGTSGTIETGIALQSPWLPIEQTNIAAFQTAWFQIQAAQTGFAGMSKWDCYWGMYDLDQQAFYAIGPPAPVGAGEVLKWPVYPMYYLLWLFSHTTEVGWNVVAVDPTAQAPASTTHLAAFAGPNAGLTVIGLDERGSAINDVSDETVSYTIGGLPAGTFNLILWNANGDGKLTSRELDVTDGVTTLTAPLQAVFAVANKQLSGLPS